MTASKVHDEASILGLAWHGDAHDVVTSAELARDMWDHLFIANLGPWVIPQIFNMMKSEFDATSWGPRQCAPRRHRQTRQSRP
jgi:hypothetical protein